MRVITPITINDTNLTSSSVPETEYPVWSSTTTYNTLGERVIHQHAVYENVHNNPNLNHIPGTDVTDPPTYWLYVSPTNQYRMFDLLRNTQTTASGIISVSLTPAKRVSSVFLGNLEADSVRVRMVYLGNVVYDRTQTTTLRETISWLGYFFGAFNFKQSVVFLDLPPYSGATVMVDVMRSGGLTAKCGSLVIGNSEFLGDLRYNAVSDALNFSVIERNEFGDTRLTPRRSVPTTNNTLDLDKSLVPGVYLIRSKLNAVPAVYVGLDDSADNYFDAFVILGVYKRFLINADFPNKATVELELEEI